MNLPIIISDKMDNEAQTYLQNKWQSLCAELAIEESKSKIYWQKINQHYNEPHRAYHNLSHIYSMLQIEDQFKDTIQRAHLFELAIWYHDIIYKATRKDNELKSAELVLEDFKNLIPEGDLGYVYQLILSTATHKCYHRDFDNSLFLDIDLAVLGTDDELYKQYIQAVRKEYKIYPTFLYNRGRKKFMQEFLTREKIYFTDFFHAHFEKKARTNIKQEIEG